MNYRGSPNWEDKMVGARRQTSTVGDLDPDLLATSFGEKTNWHVITGAPSCGKSTLIRLLSDEGLGTVPEAARQYIEDEISVGRTIDEIRANGAELQRRILDIKLKVEAGLRPSHVMFLDDAVPGSISWCRLFEIDPNTVLPHCFHRRYASVFVLDPLPVERDGIRFDDYVTGVLDDWIERDYTALGYTVVRVPVLAPDARLRYVLDRVPNQSLNPNHTHMRR